MTTVKNRGASARTWDRLVNSETGRTLHLEAGEQGETELPEGFHDQYLEVVEAPASKGKHADKPDVLPDPPEATIDPAEAPGEPEKE